MCRLASPREGGIGESRNETWSDEVERDNHGEKGVVVRETRNVGVQEEHRWVVGEDDSDVSGARLREHKKLRMRKATGGHGGRWVASHRLETAWEEREETENEAQEEDLGHLVRRPRKWAGGVQCGEPSWRHGTGCGCSGHRPLRKSRTRS